MELSSTSDFQLISKDIFFPFQAIGLIFHRETGNPKGFGYVTFASIDEATVAFDAMKGSEIDNRPVRLDYATPRAPREDGGRGGRGGGRGGARGGRGGFGDRGGRGGGRGGVSFSMQA